MRYPHRLRVYRSGVFEPAEGEEPPVVLEEDPEAGVLVVTDPETGATGAHEPKLVYDSRADVQDLAAETIYDATMPATERSDAVAFVRDEAGLSAVSTGLTAVVTWDPDGAGEDESDAEVLAVTRLDGSVKLRFL